MTKDDIRRPKKLLDMGRRKTSPLVKDLRLFLQNTWYLVISNWRLVLPFLFLYSIVNIFFTSQVVNFLLKIEFLVTGMTYIGPDNIFQFFRSPVTALLILLLLIMVCFLHVVEISCIMHAYSMANIGKKTTLRGIISTGIVSGLRAFMPKNWLMLPMLLVLVPLTGFFSLSFVSVQAVIPGFVREFIYANTLYRNLYRVLYLILLLIEITYIFAMNYHLLSDDSYPKACRDSRRLIHGRYGFTILALITVAVLFSVLVTAVSATLSSAAIKVLSRFSSSISSSDVSQLAGWILSLNSFLAALLAPAVNIAALTSLFFRYIEDKDMLATLSRDAFHDQFLSPRQLVALCMVPVFLVGFNLVMDRDRPRLPTPEVLPVPQILAHRGDSVNAPENTMPAFEIAALEHVDWIELDVHETKDGVIVVCHDDDLTRVSGQKVFVHDLTYEETQQLDVGSWFSDKFSYVRLSTLEEVFALLKDSGTKVVVEIKPTTVKTNVEENTLKVINECGMRDQSIVISTDAEILKRVRELDPDITTAYCMFVAWEKVTDIPFSDWFVIEMENVDKDLVDFVHAAGSKIFVWTINDPDGVQYLVDCGVDGILTDDPNMIKEALERAKYDTGPRQLLRTYLTGMKWY